MIEVSLQRETVIKLEIITTILKRIFKSMLEIFATTLFKSFQQIANFSTQEALSISNFLSLSMTLLEFKMLENISIHLQTPWLIEIVH